MQAKQIEGFRLSPQQKRIWLLEKGKNRSSLRLLWATSITGSLNIEVLKTALQNAVNHYEIFRTTFYRLPEMEIPLQVIADNYKLDIAEFNYQDLVGQQQETRINDLFDELKQLPFDLENKPPIQAYIINLNPNEHILVLSLSALIADSYTLKCLLNKISDSYAACLQGQNLDDEPLQYADIAEWQNELLDSDESELGREYWRKQDINTFNFWFENKQIETSNFQPQSIHLNISSDLFKKIELLSSIYQVNNANILLACWLILLTKITRKQELCIGFVGDGRKYAELDQALGLLSKYLPIACDLKAETKFSEILQQVHNSVNNACEWQEYFDWEETVKTADFCPIAFEFAEFTDYSTAGLSFSLSKYYSCIDKFKIKLTCLQQRDALITELYFDEQLYKLEDIKTLSEQLHVLLQDAIANPETAIGQLNILSDRQRQQLLVEFNNTTVSHAPDRCIHQLFEAQVKRTPNEIALIFEQQQLTYSQLNARANQLAHHLRQRGVGAEVLVGLYVERSLDAIVGLLGILKAGGAYIPLDPTYPHQRLTQMLEDAQVQVLVTQQQLLLKELPQHPPEVICLDADFATVAQQSHENPQTEVKPENLVYVVFTSGSTGKPKGVAVEHRQLFNYLNGILAKIDFSTSRSFAHVATFAADLGNTMIFPALCGGGCLHIISPERAANPEALGEYFHRHTIDCLKIVPAHLAALLTSAQTQQILPKQLLILGGEACSWQLIEQIRASAANCKIYNHYGPTETTVGVLTYPIEQNQSDSAIVPIGKAIANTQIYLLDSYLQPVPIGVPGELYIGGDSLARGYLNLPELTVAKFIANPFNTSQSERLYKTGDLARYLPDGNIEFLGRVDDQVKIRGFRIELEEISIALQQHPAVQQTIVCSREDVPGDKRLIAYIVFEPKSPIPQSSDLRAFLKEKLPEYMVPSAFVMLKTLPLTANGKIDREKLPAPEQVPPELAATFVAARNQTEEAIAKIWAEVLAVKQVGIHDNFFELGGHSLLATQVISRIRQSLQVELPLRQFFDSPTVADLAVIIAQNLGQQTNEEMLAQMLTELDELSEEESQELAQGGTEK